MIRSFNQELKELNLPNNVMYYSNKICENFPNKQKELADTLFSMCSVLPNVNVKITTD